MMLPVYWWERRRTADRWTRAEVPLLLLLGVLGVALNQFLFVVGPEPHQRGALRHLRRT